MRLAGLSDVGLGTAGHEGIKAISGFQSRVGKIGSHVLECAVCREIALEQVGQTLGWSSRPQAYAAAVERLKTALDELCKLWGIGI